MKTYSDLHALADSMGVTLQHHDTGPLGWYHHDTRTISTRRGLAPWDYKTVLAHELGHAHYEHEQCDQLSFKQERRANIYAAELLVERKLLEELAPWHRDNFDSLALELEVTPDLLQLYIELHPIQLEEHLTI